MNKKINVVDFDIIAFIRSYPFSIFFYNDFRGILRRLRDRMALIQASVRGPVKDGGRERLVDTDARERGARITPPAQRRGKTDENRLDQTHSLPGTKPPYKPT